MTYESGKTLDSIVTYHYADEDLSRENNALERYYFTKEYGFTRWESWIPLSRCKNPAFAGSPVQQGKPETCDPSSAANILRGRCDKDNIAAIDEWGEQKWVRIDCRDSTHYIPLKQGVLPTDATVARSNGLLDVMGEVVAAEQPILPTAVAGGPARSIPTGSYLDSCTSCRTEGNDLVCECKNQSGESVISKVSLSACDGVEPANSNGTLTCGASTGSSNPSPAAARVYSMPPGSFLGSCSDCHIEGADLACRCTNNAGGPSDSRLSLEACHGRQVHNDDGRLVCP